MKAWVLFLVLLLAPSGVLAQTPGIFDGASGPLPDIGWAGFRDTQFIADSLGALLLAIALGAVIGVTVREFGMVIGVVVFGIGGLIRFRTDTDSTRDTGRLIVVTLAGLIAGLGLPHFAVITTAVAFVLILAFDATPVCRIKIEQLPLDRIHESAVAYRTVLVEQGCRIIAEHKIVPKGRIEFVFRMPRRVARASLHAALCETPLETRGEIDWEVE
jgi:hypothetical protein